MIKTFTFFLILHSGMVSAQTPRILDSSVNWDSGTLTIYLTDSLESGAVTVELGSDFETHNIFNHSYTVGTNIISADNLLVIPLAGVSPGVYYVKVQINLPGSSPEMEFQTSY